MSEVFKNSYFHLLPNELLVKVLSDVDTVTVWNFCEVYECDYFFQDRRIIKNIDLCKTYILSDLNPLSKKIVFEYVNTLNINCIYWLSATNLRKFITKLVNLKTLYAMRTNLSLRPLDVETYNNIKIEKLAVTVREKDEMGFSKVKTVKTLYINFISRTSLLAVEMLFPQLAKLWVDSEGPESSSYLITCLGAGNKSKIFCRVNGPIPSISFAWGHERYYNNRRLNHFYEMCSEKFNTAELSGRNKRITGCMSEPWLTLDDLRSCLPYGPRDARRLYLNEATLENICFEELNFHHSGPFCVERYIKAQKQILKSPSARNIKKLCINSCILGTKATTDSVTVQESNSFKRKRIGVVNSAASHPAKDIFENFPDLQCLEVFHCRGSNHGMIQAYPLIAKFDKLQSLLLEIPVTVDGSFLIEVLRNCKHLACLKITSLAQHEKLNFNMHNALPNGNSLKDFRFENRRIQLDSLIERLCMVTSKKLERIVVICNEIDRFSSGPLTNLLELNPQLIFLYFLIQQATETSLKMAQRTLHIYKKKHPSKIFFAKKSVIGTIGYPIPDVHFCEMIKFESNVANLQPLEDFIVF